MTKRLIFAVVLSVIVMVISDMYLRRTYRKSVSQKTGEEQTKETAETMTGRVAAPASSLPVAEKRGKGIKIESKLYEVTFSPDGAVAHWCLKSYKQKDASLVDLVSGKKPMGDYTYEVFSLKNEKGVLLRTIADGVQITKEFVFDEKKDYQISIRFQIKNNSSQEKNISVFKWGPGVGGNINPRELVLTSWTQKGVSRWKVYKVKETIRQEKNVCWTGLGEKYFAVALMPEQTEQQRLLILKEDEGVSIQSVIEKVPAGATIEGRLFVYAGPKEEKVLKSAGNNLHTLINYGSIGKVIFFLLKLFYSITRNYGLAIILLSVLIKTVLFPLTRIGLKSMREMQKIQPQIAVLRQRFKHEPERLNQETAELYKRMKINPMGGCLPMIFQLPIFWALFVVLRDAIELRHSPFVFWIKDLSSKDPYYVLPILMGVTTFVQQKMTATDKQQSTMTYFMTIFLTVIFLKFPAGLVLYWFITNVLSIGEQRLVAKMS